MKYCDEYAALLDLYVDGELSPAEMERVQDHLNTCPGCRAYVDDALAIRAAFPDVEEAEVPAGFAEGVMAAIRAEAPAKTGRKPSRKLFWKTAAPLAACLAVIVLLQTRTWYGGKESAVMDAAQRPMVAAASAASETTESASDEAVAEPEAPAPAEAPAEDLQSRKTADALQPQAAQAPMSAAAPAAGTPQTFSAESYADAGDAASWLTLTAEEAGSLLADFTPVEETETELRYELTAEELETLLAALSEAGIVPTGEVHPMELEDRTVLVIVTK